MSGVYQFRNSVKIVVENISSCDFSCSGYKQLCSNEESQRNVPNDNCSTGGITLSKGENEGFGVGIFRNDDFDQSMTMTFNRSDELETISVSILFNGTNAVIGSDIEQQVSIEGAADTLTKNGVSCSISQQWDNNASKIHFNFNHRDNTLMSLVVDWFQLSVTNFTSSKPIKGTGWSKRTVSNFYSALVNKKGLSTYFSELSNSDSASLRLVGNDSNLLLPENYNSEMNKIGINATSNSLTFSVSEMSQGLLNHIVNAAFKGKMTGCALKMYADSTYTPLSENWLSEVYHATEFPGYKAETFDCDDFATVMKGAVAVAGTKNQYIKAGGAFGCIWYTNTKHEGHACNFFITPSLEVKLFEPQTGIVTSDFLDIATIYNIYI